MFTRNGWRRFVSPWIPQFIQSPVTACVMSSSSHQRFWKSSLDAYTNTNPWTTPLSRLSTLRALRAVLIATGDDRRQRADQKEGMSKHCKFT